MYYEWQVLHLSFSKYKVFYIYWSFLGFLDYNLSICEDQLNSDNFPIIID